MRSKKDILKGKTGLITGASRGIGKAIAIAFAEEGMNVILAARNISELEETAQDCEKRGVSAVAVPADVSLEGDVETLHTAAFKFSKSVDVVVNNVGVGKYGDLSKISASDYDWMMNANMRSGFLVTKAFSPAMLERGSGHFVFIGSVAGLKPLAGEAVYCASKHAQTAFAHSLDYEFRKKGVKVSVIAPGGVETHFAFGTGREPGMPILKDMLRDSDVAEAVLFAIQQSEKSRVFLIGMRPMSEPF